MFTSFLLNYSYSLFQPCVSAYHRFKVFKPVATRLKYSQ